MSLKEVDFGGPVSLSQLRQTIGLHDTFTNPDSNGDGKIDDLDVAVPFTGAAGTPHGDHGLFGANHSATDHSKHNSDLVLGSAVVDAEAGGGIVEDEGYVGTIKSGIDILGYVGLLFAIGAVVLTGIYIMGNVAGNNAGGAAGNLKRIIWILVGVAVIFSAPAIVKLGLTAI